MICERAGGIEMRVHVIEQLAADDKFNVDGIGTDGGTAGCALDGVDVQCSDFRRAECWPTRPGRRNWPDIFVAGQTGDAVAAGESTAGCPGGRFDELPSDGAGRSPAQRPMPELGGPAAPGPNGRCTTGEDEDARDCRRPRKFV